MTSSFEPVISNLQWPDFLGEPLDMKLLFGMGLGRALDVQFQERPAIVKVSPSPKERRFYELLAPKLNELGIDTPKLIWSLANEECNIIVLEKIPSVLPESRWRTDEEVLKFLAQMHDLGIPESEFSLQADNWTKQINKSCLEFFDERDHEYVFQKFEALRHEYGFLFRPEHIISGDPSGRNWGVRENGQLCLFDWERIGVGTAALDLMGVAFGEPEDKVFDEIAELYIRHRKGTNKSVIELAHETKVARVHISAVMLNTEAEGQGHLDPRALQYFREQFPSWLRRVFE